MPEYPLLPMLAFERGEAPAAQGRPRAPTLRLLPERQGRRLGSAFRRLASVLDEESDAILTS